MENKIKIFIACHKQFNSPKDPNYYPIQVGAWNKEKFTKITDDFGDNISSKNSSFCELTALYWIWKNADCDIAGLVHYRRYFFNKNSKDLSDVLNKHEISDLLLSNEMIVPNSDRLIRYKTIKESWDNIHYKKDWKILKDTTLEHFPVYEEAFNTVENSNSFYTCNMCICKKELLDKYCAWLFEILFDVETQIDLSSYDSYNKRLFGFMSERLFNVWLVHNKIKCVERSVYNIDDSLPKQVVISKIKSMLR